MIRHQDFRNGGLGKGGAAKYFVENLSFSDYYAKGVGVLRGKAFEHMSMKNREMNLKVFMALEQNRNPETGDRLTPRTKRTRNELGINRETGEPEIQTVCDRRPGMDLPLIVPKTLSMVMAENPGQFAEAIEAVCIAAKDKAMALAESLAQTRVRIGGAQEDRVTGNLLYLSVIHRDARPVDKFAPDPYWHAHNFIFNVCWDPVEKRLKAVQTGDIVRNKPAIDAVFLSELERGLTKLGIGTERTADGKSFEITSVKGKEVFCKRHNEIRREEAQNVDRIEALTQAKIREARKLGKTLDYNRVQSDIRNRLGKSLAKNKRFIPMEEKLDELRQQMTPEMRESMELSAVVSAPRRNWRTPQEAKEEVLHSAFKKDSVVHELAIAGALLRATGGSMDMAAALEFARSDAFIKMDDHGQITTRAVQKEDGVTRRITRAGWDIYEPMIKDPDRAIQDPQVTNAPDQAACTRFIWRSRDLVTDISGLAGAGKSTLLREVVPVLREAGHKVFLLAPTSESKKNLKEDFSDVMTLQKFQKDIERGILDLEPGTIVCLDEVSMVSMPQGHWLVQVMKEKESRLVTLGDVDQYSSVERGMFIRVLQDSGSVRSEELTTTYRAQVGYLRDTYYDLKAGRKDPERRVIGLNRLDEHGDIRECEDWEEGRGEAMETYLGVIKEGQTAIMASPIHAEARSTAAVAREMLKSERLIDAQDHPLIRLERLDVDGPELRDPRHYQAGRVIEFHTKVKGKYQPGQKWRLMEQMDDGSYRVERKGAIGIFNPRAKGKWSVYDTHEILVSVGERVRVPEGFKERGVVFENGDLPKIVAIDSERVTFEDGRSMANDFLHIDQGHCMTGYMTECRTVDQYLGLAPLSALGKLTATDVYVGTTRARKKSIWFTDCKEEFREAALRDGIRRSPYDYEKTETVAQQPVIQQMHGIDLQAGKRVGELDLDRLDAEMKADQAMKAAQAAAHAQEQGMSR